MSRPICLFPGCEKENHGRGYCITHYSRLRVSGTVNLKKITGGPCAIEGCSGKVKAKGLCLKHYTRLIKNGDPLKTKSGKVDDLREIFTNKTSIIDNGCHIWTGYRKNGYGVVGNRGKLKQAHRAMWELKKGEIPCGMQINHKCNNRACINIDHLYLGTQKENMKDMIMANRGGWLRGEKNNKSKITEDMAKEIKNSTAPRKDLANKFNISVSLVTQIQNGRAWKHV